MNATIDKGIHRAIGFLEAGQIGEALACLRALDAWREASHLRCNLAGLVYLSAKQNSPALEWFDPVLELDPANPKALRAGSLVLRDLGQFESALEFFDEALRSRPAFIEVLIDRGNILQELDCFPNNIRRHSGRIAAMM